MQCLAPITMRRQTGVNTFPCGSCLPCLMKKKEELSFRVNEEVKRSQNAVFVTLTYDDAHLPLTKEGLPTLKADDYLDFMKKVHNKQRTSRANALKRDEKIEACIRVNPKLREVQRFARVKDYGSFRQFGAGEYGDNFKRPHYHAVIMNLFPETINELETLWGKGRVHIGTVTPESVAYVAKYCVKLNYEYKAVEKPRNFMSKNLGFAYIEKHKFWHRKQGVFGVHRGQGRMTAMPRIFREKIFTVHDNERLREKMLKEATEMRAKIERAYIEEGHHPDVERWTREANALAIMKSKIIYQ